MTSFYIMSALAFNELMILNQTHGFLTRISIAIKIHNYAKNIFHEQKFHYNEPVIWIFINKTFTVLGSRINSFVFPNAHSGESMFNAWNNNKILCFN